MLELTNAKLQHQIKSVNENAQELEGRLHKAMQRNSLLERNLENSSQENEKLISTLTERNQQLSETNEILHDKIKEMKDTMTQIDNVKQAGLDKVKQSDQDLVSLQLKYEKLKMETEELIKGKNEEI